MMLPWIAYALLAAAAFAALGALLERSLGGRLIARRVIWISMMTATVVVPVVGSWLAAPRVNRVRVESNAIAPASAAPVSTPIDVDRVITIGWVALSALVILSLMASHTGLRRRLRRCERILVGDETAIISEDFGPAVVGVVRPVIALPRWALGLSEGDRRLVLAHERAHIEAHDPVVNALGLSAVVLFPWNATLWWQLQRLRLAIEIDCDARVVRHGHDPLRYGELLVSAHASVTRRVSPVLALAQRQSALAHRIDALVQTPSRSIARGIAAVGFGAALLFAVAAAPPPTVRQRVELVQTAPVVATAGRVIATRPTARPTARLTPRRSNVIVALPPAAVTPTRVDAGLTTLPPPAVVAVPPIRLRGGGGRGGAGGFIAPGGTYTMTGRASPGPIVRRADSNTVGRAVMRAVRPDSTLP
jgi:beta-lactamase regulating signal transducer with metallopeptidase domain